MAPQSQASVLPSSSSSQGPCTTSGALAPLEQLPSELLSNILTMAGEEHYSVQNRGMYYNICLVSKTIYANAIPFLYCHFVNTTRLDDDGEPPLTTWINTLAEHPNLAQHVQHLRLYDHKFGTSEEDLWNMFTSVSSAFEDQQDQRHDKFKKAMNSEDFRRQALLALRLTAHLKNLFFCFDGKTESFGRKDEAFDGYVLLKTMTRAKREFPNFLTKLRSLEMELGYHQDIDESTWEIVLLVLEFPGLDEVSINFPDRLHTGPQSPVSISNIKCLTLQGWTLFIEDVVHIIKHIRQLEHFRIQWLSERLNEDEAIDEQTDFSALVESLIPHKESLTSLIISTRHLRGPWQSFSTIESLKMFEKVEQLSLDEGTLAVNNIKWHKVPEPFLMPNLKQLTIWLNNERLLLFELLGKLAVSAPSSLKSFKVMHLEWSTYTWHTGDFDGAYFDRRSKHYKTAHFTLQCSPEQDGVIVLHTNCFQDFVHEVQQLSDPQSLLPPEFPVSPSVRELIDGSSVVSEFKQLLDKFPEENGVHEHRRAWWKTQDEWEEDKGEQEEEE